MPTDTKNPKILLITNNLGYVKDEESFMDLETVVK